MFTTRKVGDITNTVSDMDMYCAWITRGYQWEHKKLKCQINDQWERKD